MAYFDYFSQIAKRCDSLAEHSTRVARDACTYLHGLMVAGIVASAVGDELVIAHPLDELPAAELRPSSPIPRSPCRTRCSQGAAYGRHRSAAGAACWCAAGCRGRGRRPACAGAGGALAVVAVLIAVIASERIAAQRRRARGEPDCRLERLRRAPAARDALRRRTGRSPRGTNAEACRGATKIGSVDGIAHDGPIRTIAVVAFVLATEKRPRDQIAKQ